MCQIELSERDAKGTLSELLTEWRLPLLVTTTLAVSQQLTGQTNILSFTAAISRASGFRTTAPAVILGVVKVVMTIITIAFVSISSEEFGVCRAFLASALWSSNGRKRACFGSCKLTQSCLRKTCNPEKENECEKPESGMQKGQQTHTDHRR